MSTTLITFLGRTPKSEENVYRRTRYSFSDGSSSECAFFGYSLRDRLRPDHLVILGTAGSMWDHLLEQDLALGTMADEKRLELMAAVEQKDVPQSLLNVLSPTLEVALACKVTLRIIPYGHTPQEQTGIVDTLASMATAGDVLHLDVTHSFRHLPMLAMLATMHLRVTKPGLRLGGIWYGSYDEDTQTAPVYDLAGLLSLADWAECLHRYDQSGDHGVFAALLPPELGQLLSDAAFYERIQNAGNARSRLKEARRKLQMQPLQGLAALFSDELLRRIAWADEDRLYQRQRAIAKECLSRGDELRAALMGFEAFVTRVMVGQQGIDPQNHTHRDTAKSSYETQARSADRTEWENYKLLRDIRNQLAHGISSPRAEVQRAMTNSKTLRAELARLLSVLLPDI